MEADETMRMTGADTMGKDISESIKRLNHLIGEIEAAYHESSLRLGVSDSVLRILYVICSTGDCCLLSEICRQTGLSKQTVNSALRKLESQGMIVLKAVDGKAKSVCLTGEGKALASRTALRLIAVENGIFSAWDSADVQNYLDLTETFLNDLKRQVKQL